MISMLCYVANSATPSPERAMETTSSATIPLPSTVPPLSHVIATPSTASPIHTQRGSKLYYTEVCHIYTYMHTELTVSFAGDTDLTLPTASTRLFASTWPPPNTDEKFVYRWEKVSGPNEGSFDGIDKDQLDLSGVSHDCLLTECTLIVLCSWWLVRTHSSYRYTAGSGVSEEWAW